MIRAIARQAEAERERRAKIIHAEGELQAAEELVEAGENPGSAAAIAAAALSANADRHRRRKSSTIVFPLPLDSIGALFNTKPGTNS